MYSGNGLASCDLTLDVMEAEQPWCDGVFVTLVDSVGCLGPY